MSPLFDQKFWTYIMVKTIFWHFFSLWQLIPDFMTWKFSELWRFVNLLPPNQRKAIKKKTKRPTTLSIRESWGHEFNNSDRPFLEHHYYLHVIRCLIYAHELRRKCLKKYINFTIFTTNYLPLRRERLVKLTISCLLAIQINRM